MSFLFPDTECFRVIHADPPWAYDNFGQAKHGAARSAYGDASELMTLDDLAAIPVHKWAGDDAVLVLWATWPKLDEALALIELWGFGYVTGFPWVKTVPSSGEVRCGIGFWTQSTSEIVLIARTGALTRKEAAPRVRGLLVGEEAVFYAPLPKHTDQDGEESTHSAKPIEVHEWIEKTIPGPYLELFARRPREGWTTWGHELGQHLSAKGVEPWAGVPCR
jgi:site-specific DNA-methyltransferase (adenine-specific)